MHTYRSKCDKGSILKHTYIHTHIKSAYKKYVYNTKYNKLIYIYKDYTTGNATFKQGSRGTVIEATSRKDGKLKVKLDNDNTKTFRLINECDLQLYEGVSFNSQSQTEEQSFEY